MSLAPTLRLPEAISPAALAEPEQRIAEQSLDGGNPDTASTVVRSGQQHVRTGDTLGEADQIVLGQARCRHQVLQLELREAAEAQPQAETAHDEIVVATRTQAAAFAVELP